MAETNPITTAAFVIYILGVLLLALISHRVMKNREFMGEYFLGSRGMKSWTLAFAFAATATSAGSYIGFPALIYSYGWVLAFWVASYMIYPLTAMGIFGKRLNQIARKSGAITVPDVLRDRFDSPALGLMAALAIAFFTTCNLVAQFKAGAIIIEETFNFPSTWGYTVGLLIFSVVVVLYTSFGGFRAVVWTDVMQGVVMGLGVVLLCPIVISHVGGLDNAAKRVMSEPASAVTSISGENNDLAFLRSDDGPETEPQWVRYVLPAYSNTNSPSAEIIRNPGGESCLEVILEADSGGNVVTTAAEIRNLVTSDPVLSTILEDVVLAYDNDGSGIVAPMEKIYFIGSEEYMFGPGRKSDGLPFHPLGLAMSYFVMWAIVAMGQPGMMVRLMAFKDSRSLRRAIIIVTFYFTLIYIPLVLIFTSAKVLLPYVPPEAADKAMILVATRVVGDMGPLFAVLAAIFVAAPFAAVMSTVDSFLLMISSSIVRDFYQRTVNPNVSERKTKWISYCTTVTVGVIVTIGATQQIDFLQYIVVFTSSGFASAFLAPVCLSLYWKGTTRVGAISSFAGGLAICLLMFIPTLFGGVRIDLFGLHPVVWGLLSSFLIGIAVSLFDPERPRQDLVERYFMKG
jgi:sodium/pantothenate symporter